MKVIRMTDDRVKQVCELLSNCDVGLDIETTSKDKLLAHVSVIQLYFNNVSYLFPIRVIDAKLSNDSLVSLSKLISTLGITGHNLYYDVSIIYKDFNVFPRKIVDDTYILALMGQQKNCGLKDLALVAAPELATKLKKYEDIELEDNDGTLIYSFTNIAQVAYMAYDPYLPFIVKPMVYKPEFEKAYQVELNAIIPLAKSTIDGMKTDMSKSDSIISKINADYEQLQSKVDSDAGWHVRPNSSKDVCKLLFEDMHLTVPPITTSTGGVSASAESLAYLEGVPMVDNLVELKHLKSVQSTMEKFGDTYVAADGRIHPFYNQIGFDGTSRIYTQPSVNQLPMEARGCIVADKGKRFVLADWKSAEMYIAEYMSGQENLLEVYNGGGDIHSWLASKVLGIESPSHEQREVSKVCEFAFIYGSEGAAVSRKLKVSDDAGKALVQKYLAFIPDIKALRDRVQSESDKTHYTHTILGRPRYLEKYNNPATVNEARRQAFNTMIQGSCADLQKIAIRRLYDLHDSRVQFKFTVFDSFLLEVDDGVSNAEIEEIMTKVSDFSDMFPGFKLRYSYGVAQDWQSAQLLS